MKETAPCPWCKDKGRVFLHLTRNPAMSFSVQCTTCLASGPHVKIDAFCFEKKWQKASKTAEVIATDRWNELYDLIRGDNDEKSG